MGNESLIRALLIQKATSPAVDDDHDWAMGDMAPGIVDRGVGTKPERLKLGGGVGFEMVRKLLAN